MIINNSYTITNETALMYTIFDKSGYEHAMIHEQYKKVQVAMTVKEILKENCILHGCTLEGKMGAAKGILKGKRMLPLCLSTQFRICLFPTQSADKKDCMWFALNHIYEMEPCGDKTVVTLKNHERIIVPVSCEILMTKKAFAADLMYTYMNHQYKLESSYRFGPVTNLVNPSDPDPNPSQPSVVH